MILALMPLTAWSGMSHVGCRCSTGEIRLHCPKLNHSQMAAGASSIASASRSGESTASRDGKATTRSCCQSAKQATNKSENQVPPSCAESCQCTPVLLEGNSGAKLRSEKLPVVGRSHFVSIAVSVSRLPCVTRGNLDAIDMGPHELEDLIVLFERFLI